MCSIGWNFVLWYYFAFVHTLVLYKLYLPIVKSYVNEFIVLRVILGKWSSVLQFYMDYFSSKLRQFINGTCTKLNDNEYLLNHVINGELIKIIIRKSDKEIADIQNISDDSTIEQDALAYKRFIPYLLYKPILPDYNKVNVIYTDGSIEVM